MFDDVVPDKAVVSITCGNANGCIDYFLILDCDIATVHKYELARLIIVIDVYIGLPFQIDQGFPIYCVVGYSILK